MTQVAEPVQLHPGVRAEPSEGVVDDDVAGAPRVLAGQHVPVGVRRRRTGTSFSRRITNGIAATASRPTTEARRTRVLAGRRRSRGTHPADDVAGAGDLSPVLARVEHRREPCRAGFVDPQGDAGGLGERRAVDPLSMTAPGQPPGCVPDPSSRRECRTRPGRRGAASTAAPPVPASESRRHPEGSRSSTATSSRGRASGKVSSTMPGSSTTHTARSTGRQWRPCDQNRTRALRKTPRGSGSSARRATASAATVMASAAAGTSAKAATPMKRTAVNPPRAAGRARVVRAASRPTRPSTRPERHCRTHQASEASAPTMASSPDGAPSRDHLRREHPEPLGDQVLARSSHRFGQGYGLGSVRPQQDSRTSPHQDRDGEGRPADGVEARGDPPQHRAGHGRGGPEGEPGQVQPHAQGRDARGDDRRAGGPDEGRSARAAAPPPVGRGEREEGERQWPARSPAARGRAGPGAGSACWRPASAAGGRRAGGRGAPSTPAA